MAKEVAIGNPIHHPVVEYVQFIGRSFLGNAHPSQASTDIIPGSRGNNHRSVKGRIGWNREVAN